MVTTTQGILSRRIADSPIAVIDFETTGLTPGVDRVIEVSVVRIDPGQKPRLIFDTLVNPKRRMAATEIHGISDSDVADAPVFEEIAGELINALADCVVSAYNVYFDIKFLAFELDRAGVLQEPPHFCLMYMRPLLGLGSRCNLMEACKSHGIEYDSAHVAASDVEASGQLLLQYLEVLEKRGISTFGEMATLKDYKFFRSFTGSPFADPTTYNLSVSNRRKSRYFPIAQVVPPIDPIRLAISAYWDALKGVLADLDISDDELAYMTLLKERLELKPEQLRMLHARAFASAILQFINDQWLDDREARKLRYLHACLGKLGWAPGM